MTLVDTGPLVALCDPRDSRHAIALAHLDQVASSGLELCDAVIAEACFHLPRVDQRERLRGVLNDLRIECLPTDDPGLRADVFDWLIKYEEHEPDWADGCLAVLCGRDPRRKVWTYDREFRSIWRRPDGRAIPMAVRF